MYKKTVLVLFGGTSSEHEVSRESAATIISNLDDEKYYIITVGITKEGKWLLYSGDIDKIRSGAWEKYGTRVVLASDGEKKFLMRVVKDKVKNIPIDVVFPALHGNNGEDGTMQGFFEVLGIPYVGCGVLSSAACMDKSFTKIIANSLNIQQAEYVTIKSHENMEEKIDEIEKRLHYPCFVKPANAGSSIGISKARDREQLVKAIESAFQFDRKILVERAIAGKELECSILGGVDPFVSTVGEIVPGAEFYDYEAKYINNESKVIIPSDIPRETIQQMRGIAKQIFLGLDCYGIARVDFFLEEETNIVYFNEINTMPGFTKISMYPMLLLHEGLEIKNVLDILIDMAIDK